MLEGFGKPSTAETRRILPDSTPLHRAYVEASKPALTLLALESEDCLLLEKTTAGVRVVEDARAKLYPYYREVRRILQKAGAVGVGLAGAGPTVFAILCSQAGQ